MTKPRPRHRTAKRLRRENAILAEDAASLRVQLEAWMEAHGVLVKRSNEAIAARNAAEATLAQTNSLLCPHGAVLCYRCVGDQIIDHQIATGGLR